MGKSHGFRAWYYFRMGWSVYFAFIFAAINTLTVTYYLAIEKIPTLEIIFPNFIQYVLIVTGIGIPILIVVGYGHYKKSRAFKSEADILVDSNPYLQRTIVNSEMNLQLNLKLIQFIINQSKNEKLSKSELDELLHINEKISELVKSRTFSNKDDLNYIKRELKE